MGLEFSWNYNRRHQARVWRDDHNSRIFECKPGLIVAKTVPCNTKVYHNFVLQSSCSCASVGQDELWHCNFWKDKRTKALSWYYQGTLSNNMDYCAAGTTFVWTVTIHQSITNSTKWVMKVKWIAQGITRECFLSQMIMINVFQMIRALSVKSVANALVHVIKFSWSYSVCGLSITCLINSML